MHSFLSDPAAGVLNQLFLRAEAADRPLVEALGYDGTEISAEQMKQFLEEEIKDYRAVYRSYAGNYLNVSPEFGRFLYMCARTSKARRIVEFGTSFGVSAIHLACALRDNGGGQLIGTELESTKAESATKNLADAGVADLAEIRVGDALETLREGIGGEIDLVHLDGAFHLYLPVLQLLEPLLKTGALVIGENAVEPAYLDYVRNPQNGYLSVAMPFEAGRGNEFTVVTR